MSNIRDPWDWQPSLLAWSGALRSRIWAWRPDPALEFDPVRVRDVLDKAAVRAEGWLFHPAMHALFAPATAPKNDVQLSAWAAAHAEAELGTITLHEPLWIWSASGGESLPSGRHDLAELGSSIASDDYSLPIALDLWLDSVSLHSGLDVGFANERLWRNAHARDGAPERIEADVVRFLHALNLALTRMPRCAQWLAAVTRVVVPLVPTADASFNSSSQPELPGLVFSDMKDEAQILE